MAMKKLQGRNGDDEATTMKRWWGNGGEETERKLVHCNDSDEDIVRKHDRRKEGVEPIREGQQTATNIRRGLDDVK